MALELTTASEVSNDLVGGSSLESAVTPFVFAAERLIQLYCNRETQDGDAAWGRAERTEYISGLCFPVVVLKWTPITAVTSVSIVHGVSEAAPSSEIESQIDTTALTCDGIAIDDLATMYGMHGRLQFRGSESRAWGDGEPTFGGGRQKIKVVYAGGWPSGNIPQDLNVAARLLAAHLYRSSRRDGAMKSENLGEYSYTIADRDASAFQIPPDVAMILAPRRRPPDL